MLSSPSRRIIFLTTRIKFSKSEYRTCKFSYSASICLLDNLLLSIATIYKPPSNIAPVLKSHQTPPDFEKSLDLLGYLFLYLDLSLSLEHNQRMLQDATYLNVYLEHVVAGFGRSAQTSLLSDGTVLSGTAALMCSLEKSHFDVTPAWPLGQQETSYSGLLPVIIQVLSASASSRRLKHRPQ